ncbi:hypothetical protein QBC34DRAFT_345777 [Podospora aff. communis PSN243]|uniref:Transporter n=1 Tax=Podospora aff. communis PSN243 TaxID=3040156 RepID=A0AAV9GWI5_9PEZI|nr:hypothetical protein QBC34DRAFT_345777 [Podospora aff. communis PSN243]
MRDQRGSPTLTVTLGSPSTRSGKDDTAAFPGATYTLTAPNRNPTAAVVMGGPGSKPTAAISPPADGDVIHLLSGRQYWAILCLPVFFATIGAIMAEMVASNLRTLLPFRELTRPGGADAKDSLVRPTGLFHDLAGITHHKDPLPVLSSLLVIFSAAIAGLSSEAVGIKLGGDCKANDFTGCYMGVAVFLPPARTLQALLAVNLAFVVCLAVLTWRWRSGIATPPGNIATVAALSRNSTLRDIFHSTEKEEHGSSGSITDADMTRNTESHRFRLCNYRDIISGGTEYGIIATQAKHASAALGEMGPLHRVNTIRRAVTSTTKRTITSYRWFNTASHTSATKGLIFDCCGVLFFLGLAILIAYYNATVEPDTGFERFMTDQNFGVRLLFTTFGVLLTFFWDSYYSRLTTALPPRAFNSPSKAPPSTVFAGFIDSLLNLNPFESIVGFTTILAKFLPILLSNVPFSPIQTWKLHLVCTWATEASLGLMVFVVGYGRLFWWRRRGVSLPVNMGTLAGRIYYVYFVCGGHGRKGREKGEVRCGVCR